MDRSAYCAQMQVKVFNKNSALVLEQEINDWLAKNPDVEIRFSNQSQSRQSELGASMTVTIVYEEKE